MVRLSGAEAIAQTLAACGVEYIFQLSGGTRMKLIPAIEDAGIKPVVARSEKAAVYIADGYSRASFKPGVCFGQAGPGAINLSAGMSEPYWSFTPVIALTGGTPDSEIYKFQYQELDEMSLFLSTVKWNVKITHPRRASEIVRDAFQIATSGSPGPVHVNIPYDVSSSETEMLEPYGDKSCCEYPSTRVRPDFDKIKETADLLVRSDTPVIVAGAGSIISRAWDETMRLAEMLCIPVATSFGGKGVIPENHPLSIGVVGTYSNAVTNKIVEDADLVFFVGCRADGLTTDNWTVPKYGSCKIVQLDNNPNVIGRNYPVAIGIIGDCKLALRDLICCLERKRLKRNNERQLRIRKAIDEWSEVLKCVECSNAVPIKPHRVMKEIRDFLNRDDILVADTGQIGAWAAALHKVSTAGRTVLHACGTLGWSFAAALGAKFAAPNRRVLNLIGDGGIAYHISELETALRWEKPFVALVLNNRSLGMVHLNLQDLGRNRFAASDFVDVDYGKVAESFGAYGRRIERPGELKDALRQAFNSQKPAILDIIVDLNERAPISYYRKLPSSRQI